jgi:hypothetical protein
MLAGQFLKEPIEIGVPAENPGTAEVFVEGPGGAEVL